VREETGLTVQLTGLLGFYLDRYVHRGQGVTTLNIYFLGRVLGGDAQPGDDAAACGWFSPGELPRRIAFAHARQVLHDWAQRAASEADE
jgi:8-oxo-dGTP pyrophosphatase MutT (NUDIX family)